MKADRHLSLLVGRVLVVLVLVMSGFDKLTHADRTADYLRSIGAPGAGPAVALATGLLEFAGGVALLIGWQTRRTALVLAVYLVPVIWLTHLAVARAADDPVLRVNETMQAMKSLSMLGGLLLLRAAGPGVHSVDGK